jgi:glucoamylase
MLPEQVWDHEDLPSEGMYEGRSAGSAQPLVWAHAEYLKLLRSVVDGKVFDLIPVVADRYAVPPGTRTFKSTIEIFQLARPIPQMPAGYTLRVIDANRFNVVYTLDNWQTQQTVNSRNVGYPGAFVDIPTPAAGDWNRAGDARLIFTIHWPESPSGPDHWLGRNLEVPLVTMKNL